MSARLRTMRLLGLAAAAVCLAALLPGPVGAAAPPTTGDRLDPDPGTMTLRGRCLGGGRVKLTVREPADDGSAAVEVDVRNVAVGSRWNGSIGASNGPGGGPDDYDDFRGIVAADGTWSYDTTLEPPRNAAYDLSADTSHSERSCFLLAFPAGRFQGGLVFCRPYLFSATFLRLGADGDLGSRFSALPLRRRASEPWQVEFRVSGEGGSQRVVVQDRSGPRGGLRTRARLTGFDDPRVYVEATDEANRPCSMGVNASEVTAERVPSAAAVRRMMRELTG